jgi:hypothetical protein
MFKAKILFLEKDVWLESTSVLMGYLFYSFFILNFLANILFFYN